MGRRSTKTSTRMAGRGVLDPHRRTTRARWIRILVAIGALGVWLMGWAKPFSAQIYTNPEGLQGSGIVPTGVQSVDGIVGLHTNSTTDWTSRASSLASLEAAPNCADDRAVPETVWPPNESFVPISIAGVTDSDGNPIPIAVDSIFQDESLECDSSAEFGPN